MKKLLTTASLFAVSSMLFAPLAVLAVDITLEPPPTPEGTGPSTVDEGISILNQILTWISIIFWIVAVIFILYAAFLYLTAAGDAEKVKKASSQLLYAVIAIAVALMATIIPSFVANVLTPQ